MTGERRQRARSPRGPGGQGDPRGQGARRGPATAQALVDAAEERFALDGFAGASLRAVMRAAGADPGSIHYHFGGRPTLAGAVLDRVLAPLNARRLELLDRAVDRNAPAPVPVAELMAALVHPDLEVAADLRRRGPERARLVGAIYIDPAAFVTERVEAHFAPVARRFQPELARAIPGADPEIVAWRIRWFVFGTVGALLSDRAALDGPFDELAGRLVAGATALLSDLELATDEEMEPEP